MENDDSNLSPPQEVVMGKRPTFFERSSCRTVTRKQTTFINAYGSVDVVNICMCHDKKAFIK